MDTMQETLTTPVRGAYDVIVCGGGIGGAAAAVAAARGGVSVLLIEKSIQLGGLATRGLIGWYEPICDGLGHKLMYGMADELLRLAIRYGNDTLDGPWQSDPDESTSKKRYATFFSPAAFTMALDGFVADSGVQVLLDTVITRPVMEGGRCSGIVVENKTGRTCYRAGFVIDATGDADVMARAGAPCETGVNYLTYIGYLVDRDSCQNAVGSGNLLDARRWERAGSDLWGNGHPADFPKLSGVTAEEVTEYVLQGRRLFLDAFRKRGRTAVDAAVLPGMAQLRTTRHILGEYVLTEADEGRGFADSVAVAADFAHRGKWYEIPLRTLYCSRLDNLMTAGRTISSAGWAWDVTRVIPVAAATGQAAGTAAALCVKNNTAVGRLPAALLQRSLASAGARISIHSQNNTKA